MSYIDHDFDVKRFRAFSSSDIDDIIQAAMPLKGPKPDFDRLIFDSVERQHPVRATLALRSLLNAASSRFFVALDRRGRGEKGMLAKRERIAQAAAVLLSLLDQDIDGEGISNLDSYITLLSGSFGDPEDDSGRSECRRFPEFCDSLRLLIFKMNLSVEQPAYPDKTTQLMADLTDIYELIWQRDAGFSRDPANDESGPFLRFLERTYSVISGASASPSALAKAFQRHKGLLRMTSVTHSHFRSDCDQNLIAGDKVRRGERSSTCGG